MNLSPINHKESFLECLILWGISTYHSVGKTKARGGEHLVWDQLAMWRLRISGVIMFQAEVISVKTLRLEQAWIVRGTQSEWELEKGSRKDFGVMLRSLTTVGLEASAQAATSPLMLLLPFPH